MEHLRCVVERITYQNADNGYTVLKCAVKNYSDLVTVVGTMPDTHVGSVLFLEGMWKMDAKYGRDDADPYPFPGYGDSCQYPDDGVRDTIR